MQQTNKSHKINLNTIDDIIQIQNGDKTIFVKKSSNGKFAISTIKEHKIKSRRGGSTCVRDQNKILIDVEN